MRTNATPAECGTFRDNRLKALFRLLSPVLLTLVGIMTAAIVTASDSQRYRTIEWVDLLPADDLDALLNPPEMLADIEDGSPEDQFTRDGGLAGVYGDSDAAQRFEAALQSTAVRGEFDGTRVRIAGFIVPLAFDERHRITEFFLVPYFGACLHMPPPPPNQIIHSTFSGGPSLHDIYEPYWLEGMLSVEREDNALGTSAYYMDADRISRYAGE